MPIDDAKCMGLLFDKGSFFEILTKNFTSHRQPAKFHQKNLVKGLLLHPNPE